MGWPASEDRLRGLVVDMCDRIVHRGPDAAGYFVHPGVGLGMRRLSIIDLGGGHQPIHSEDGSVTTVFNGEIYNYQDLRDSLRARGHTLSTQSDTETIVHLYEDEGPALVERLNGMFGLAVWDANRRRLLLARDRLGIKPLYYWESDHGLAFASELKSLLALPEFPRELDLKAVAYYLTLGYVPAPFSIFGAVRKLEPGHWLTWDEEAGVSIQQYWTPVRPIQRDMTAEYAEEKTRELVKDAVSRRLVADVPLGAFLSGGVDSSTVVAMMSQLTDRPVKTFSIGFEEREFNEADDARAVAEHLGTDHAQLTVRPDADALIEQVVASFDEPFADPSAIPTYLVSRLAREQVTVSLSGDGGDELFGGYTRYTDALARNRDLPGPLRKFIASVGPSLPYGMLGRGRFLELGRSARGRYAGQLADPLAPSLGGVARPEVLAELPDFDGALDRWFDRTQDRDYASQMMMVDILSYLPGDILTKVDRSSMAVSLEARVPLLDHRLVEFAVSIPSALKLRGDGKWPLRRVAQDALPARVYEKRKQGFSVPLRKWFREDLRHRVDALTRSDAPIYDFVTRAGVKRLLSEHLRGRRDHHNMLWRLMVLDLFLTGIAPTDSTPVEVLTMGTASGD